MIGSASAPERVRQIDHLALVELSTAWEPSRATRVELHDRAAELVPIVGRALDRYPIADPGKGDLARGAVALATTGLRISEAIALQRLHLQLDGSEPEVCIRRAIVKDRIEPPKTKYGRREIRLPDSLGLRLRAHFAEQTDQDSTALAFPNEAGGVIDPNNVRRRVLKPLVEEVNAPWAGFHTFRHTFASIHLSEGTNLLQLSRALGHHSAAFTLSRYTHLLPGDMAPPLDVASGLSAASSPDRRSSGGILL